MGSRGLAIFDFDGTLADSAGWFFEVVNEVAEEHGLPALEPAERQALRDLSTREILRRYRVPLWKLPGIGRTMRRIAARDIDRIKPFPWVPDLLLQLAGRDVAIAIVSSNAEDTIRRVLGAEITSFISHFGTGASLFGKASKLKTSLVACAASAERTASIGDEVRDVEAAQAAGLASLAATWGYASARALKSAQPTQLIDDPMQIIDWFDGQR